MVHHEVGVGQLTLPIPIDRRMEPRRVSGDPALLADDEILGVQLERRLPLRQGLVTPVEGIKQPPQR